LISYLPGNSQSFDLGFPATKGTYHWQQSSEQDKNDSLSADFIYNTNPNVYGYGINAYAKDFTIIITRYDSNKGGIVAGTFSGTMEAFAAWKQQTVTISVSGSFSSTRTGRFGVECRKLRRSEKLVVQNARSVINRCIAQPLQRIDWVVKNTSDIPPSVGVDPNPYRPFGFCSGIFDLTIGPDPNSEYGKMIDDSIRYYTSATTVQAVLRGVLLQQLKNIKIRIDLNSPYIKTPFQHNPTDKFTVLSVPGAAYAYCLTLPEKGAPADVPPDYKTYILLGPWAGVDRNASTYVNYPFVHKQPGAYIETISVQIIGPASIADKIIHNVDWEGLNAVLTK